MFSSAVFLAKLRKKIRKSKDVNTFLLPDDELKWRHSVRGKYIKARDVCDPV